MLKDGRYDGGEIRKNAEMNFGYYWMPFKEIGMVYGICGLD